MANYYHEARAQVKKIKVLQEEGKKRAEKRAELMAPVVCLRPYLEPEVLGPAVSTALLQDFQLAQTQPAADLKLTPEGLHS